MLLRGISRRISTFTTYYDILGIPPNSNEEAIKTAYRNLAKKYHPDVSSEHENMFRLINEAYHILSNLKVRAQYDKTKQQMTQEEVNRILKQERGKSGLPVGPQEARTEYAQKRLQELADERKKFNVDTFNKYRGGIPIKDGRTKRANIHGGEGLEGPGSRANPGMIDFLQERDSHMAPWNQKVGSVEVKQFNLSKIRDQNQTATKVKQWLPLEIDTTFHHMKNFIRFWAYWGTLISIPIVLYVRSELKKAQNRSKIAVLREQASKEGVQLAGMAPAYFK